MPDQNAPFPLGRVVATRGAAAELTHEDITNALRRHESGDWGDIHPGDAGANEAALKAGSRLLSVYVSSEGTKFWIITEADRSVTTVLLPEEY